MPLTRTLAEALVLAATQDNARLLAGGQSLMPLLNLRLAAPDHLIDLGRVDELVGIEQTAAGLAIGAMTTQRSLERSPLVRARCPLLAEALEHVGHPATRNRGTIGGSLCHLDPSAELPVVAMALDARLTIASRDGTRSIPFAELSAGYLTTQLAPHEILTRVELPVLGERTGWAFVEFARRRADFAIVAVAAMIECDADNCVRRARIAIGGLGPAPVRATAAEAAARAADVSDRLNVLVPELVKASIALACATVAAVVALMLVAPWPTETVAAARFAAVSVIT